MLRKFLQQYPQLREVQRDNLKSLHQHSKIRKTNNGSSSSNKSNIGNEFMNNYNMDETGDNDSETYNSDIGKSKSNEDDTNSSIADNVIKSVPLKEGGKNYFTAAEDELLMSLRKQCSGSIKWPVLTTDFNKKALLYNRTNKQLEYRYKYLIKGKAKT